jgi:hypothetical protein
MWRLKAFEHSLCFDCSFCEVASVSCLTLARSRPDVPLRWALWPALASMAWPSSCVGQRQPLTESSPHMRQVGADCCITTPTSSRTYTSRGSELHICDD